MRKIFYKKNWYIAYRVCKPMSPINGQNDKGTLLIFIDKSVIKLLQDTPLIYILFITCLHSYCSSITHIITRELMRSLFLG